MDEFDLCAMKSKKPNQTNSYVRFLGESMVCQSPFEINWPLVIQGLLNKNVLQKSGGGAAITPLPPCSYGSKLLTASRPQGKEM